MFGEYHDLVFNTGTRCRLLTREAMYRFYMSSWIRGFFAILWAWMYGEMLLGVGVW